MILTEETIDKFDGLTNAEAYVEVFHNMVMEPFREEREPGTYRGNSHRLDFYAVLRPLLDQYIDQDEIKILDIGAGSGEVVRDVLSNYKVKISPVEPNPLMLFNYMSAVGESPNISFGSVYRGPVQELYAARGTDLSWFKALEDQNVITALHMIYSLTDIRKKTPIHPTYDLLKFVSTMYNKLEDGGVLFIVYADLESTIIGEAGLHYYDKTNPRISENIKEVWKARQEVLETPLVAELLDTMYPGHACKHTVVRTDSKFYGDTINDIVSYCTLGELTAFDENPFDMNKLYYTSEFIEQNFDKFDVKREIHGPWAGMLTTRTPQVICSFKKMQV